MIKQKSILAGFVSVLTLLLNVAPAVAATSVVISEPSNGQSFTGNNFKVSGTTDPNSTVLVKKGTTVLKQTVSGGDGKWSADLVNLPDGENKISAKVIKNTGFAYFASTPDAGATIKFNRLRFSDNSINPGGSPWPITTSAFYVGLMPTPNNNIFYAFASAFNPSTKPARFDASSPTDPITVTGSYPANPGSNKPDFNSDGSKMYSPNINGTEVSVVNPVTNAWVKDIDMTPNPAIMAIRDPDGRMFIARQNKYTSILDTSNDTITKTFQNTCDVSSYSFSEDPSYPYYYGYCLNDGKILQLNRSDDSTKATWNVGYNPTGGYLTFDNSKLYFYSTTFLSQPGSDKIGVVDTTTGSTKFIQLSAGIAGFLASPDGQKLYIATPGTGLAFNTNNIDIVDLGNDTVADTVSYTEAPIVVSYAPSQTAETAIADVSVVLGAKTTSGSLAETGALAVSVTLLLGLIIGSSAFVYYDYRRHKKPLVAEDANVHYTLLHHVKIVTIPLLKYRLSFQFESKQSADGIHKF